MENDVPRVGADAWRSFSAHEVAAFRGSLEWGLGRQKNSMMRVSFTIVGCLGGLLTAAAAVPSQRQMENLTRGIVAVETCDDEVYIGWRLFATDPESIAFNVYRLAGGSAPVRLNAVPLSRATNYVLDGLEYFSIFDGQTGAALETVDYIPNRHPIDGWGGIGGNGGNDSYGNRCDRSLACVAYLDGERPSVVMCRGVYGRIAMAAWDWRDGELTRRYL